jgi:aminopeptidase N
VRLDLADELEVSAVDLDGESIDFEQADDGLVMQTGDLEADSQHTATISYAVEPAPTKAPSLRTDMGEGLGWQTDELGNVFTFQEPYGAFTWYPVNDHPSDEALYDARITTHDGDVGVFNGKLEATDREGDTTVNTWHLAEPAASYLTTIAIGPYTEHVEKTPGGMDISYWLTDLDEHKLEPLAEEGGNAFDWLVKHAGPYPFETLGVVVVAGNSAMETETMITMSSSAVEREDAVLQHEMAHQWFGDSLTPRTWQGVWLNEGFAMYYQQWYETDMNRQPYGGGLAQWSYFDQLSRVLSGPPGDYNPESFGASNVYLSPALMLDMIRQRVGDKKFERLLIAWAREHEGQTVDRETFTTWLNEKTGRDFTPLIARWLDSKKTPAYSQ